MALASWELAGIFALMITGAALYALSDTDRTKNIFDFFKISLPPVASLILGSISSGIGDEGGGTAYRDYFSITP